MTIAYEVTESDIEQFNVDHARMSKAIRRTRALAKWTVAVIILGAGALVLFVNDPHALSIFVGAFIVVAVAAWLIFYDRYFLHRVRKIARKMLTDESNTGLTGTQSIVVDDERLQVSNSSGASELTRGALKRVVETERHLYCYTSSVNALVIPKRAFDGTQDLAELKRQLETYLTTPDA